MTVYFCTPCNREHVLEEMGGKLCRDYVYYTCKDDLPSFGWYFLPGDFRRKFKSPPFHKEVGNRMVSSDPGLHLALIAWRDSAKSMMAKAALLNHLGYRKRGSRENVVWLCETEDQAVDHIKYLQRNLETNPAFRYYFGDYYGRGNWTKRGFETERGDLFRPLGMTQKPRGRSHFVDWEEGSTRITKLVLDDFESENNTKTRERRAYNKAFVSGALLPTLDKTPGKEGVAWLLGTLVAHDTYMSDLDKEFSSLTEGEKKDFWEVFRYPATLDGALTDHSIPTWPDKFPVSELRKIKRRDFFLAPNRFWIEYMQDLDNPEDTSVALESIQYHSAEFVSRGGFTYLVIGDKAIPVYIYIGVDPAGIGESKKHDYHAIVVMAVDGERNRYVLEIFNEHMPLYDVAPVLLRLGEKYSPVRRVNVEKNAAGHLFKDLVSRKSISESTLLPGLFEGIPAPPGVEKSDRLISCYGRLLRDKKLFIRHEHDILMNQMRGLPSPQNDDALDAGWYADFYAGELYPSSPCFPVDQMGEKSQKKKVRRRSWRDSVWQGIDWRTGVRA